MSGHEQDTILIFQKPDLYFFPHYREITFPPFCIPQRSLRYLLYKALYLLHIPLCSLFWGNWKDRLKTAKRVIIFDYGYQRGMETYIKKVNPDCRVYLFMWNHIDRYHYNHRLFSDKDAIYSTDPGDCQRYHLRYNHIFYPKEYCKPPVQIPGNKLFFIGQDKGRGPYLLALRRLFLSCGIDCDIRVLSHSKDSDYLRSIEDIYTAESLSYDAYCKELESCSLLLDINQSGQRALTMRVLESIFYSKKLITDNQDILACDFYDDSNIFLLPENRQLPDQEALAEFLAKPFRPYSPKTIEAYSYENWLRQFQ